MDRRREMAAAHRAKKRVGGRPTGPIASAELRAHKITSHSDGRACYCNVLCAVIHYRVGDERRRTDDTRRAVATSSN